MSTLRELRRELLQHLSSKSLPAPGRYLLGHPPEHLREQGYLLTEYSKIDGDAPPHFILPVGTSSAFHRIVSSVFNRDPHYLVGINHGMNRFGRFRPYTKVEFIAFEGSGRTRYGMELRALHSWKSGKWKTLTDFYAFKHGIFRVPFENGVPVIIAVHPDRIFTTGSSKIDNAIRESYPFQRLQGYALRHGLKITIEPDMLYVGARYNTHRKKHINVLKADLRQHLYDVLHLLHLYGIVERVY